MPPDPPRTLAEAIDGLLAQMTAEQRGRLRAVAEADLGDLHFTLGMSVRNVLRLWGNDELLRAVAGTMRPAVAAEIARLHTVAGDDPHAREQIRAVFGRFLTQESVDPDAASGFLIRQAWQRLRDQASDA